MRTISKVIFKLYLGNRLKGNVYVPKALPPLSDFWTL